LEDLAAIVDRLRVLFRKKDESIAPKKLIAKNPGRVDELAGAFDKRLTQIMVRLARILKDTLVTKSQKWAEIEKSKFLLYNFCMENGLNFLLKNKANLSPKDLKELQHALSKAREGLCAGFVNLGSLFYSKDEKEMQELCNKEGVKVRTKLEEKARVIEGIEGQLQNRRNAINDLEMEL